MTTAKKKRNAAVEPRPAKISKLPTRVYLSDKHKHLLQDELDASGMNCTQLISRIVEDYLRRKRNFRGKTELAAFGTYLRNKGKTTQQKEMGEAISAFLDGLDQRRPREAKGEG